MSTTPTGPGRRSADPWTDAGPAPARPRPGSDPGSGPGSGHETDLLWSTRQDLRRTLDEAQDNPATGFESVADRVHRDYARRPALSLWTRGWRAAGNLFRHDNTPARLTAYAGEAQGPVTTGRRIAVVSLRGGAGKTTVSALMARTFATLRPEPVAAVDLDPGLGSLGLRLGHQPAPGADSTAAALAALDSTSFDSVASLLAAGPEDLYYTGPRVSGGPLGEAGTTTLLSALSRYFPVTVLDCPTGLSRADTAAVLARSHAAVFVVPATASGVDEARGFLGHWLTDPYLSAIPVIAAVVATDRSGVLDPLAQAAALTRVGVDAVALRHDRHLAGGVGIGMHLTRPENRLAATELCARILTAANTHGARTAPNAPNAPAGGAR